MKIVVLQGGSSNEREVSLRSASHVIRFLKQLGEEVVSVDPSTGLKNIFKHHPDIVIPMLHGAGGEDGSTQEFLETQHIPYLGSSSITSRLCFDKVSYKQKLKQFDVLTPQWEVVDRYSFRPSRLSDAAFVLKPIKGGSSIDTFICRDAADLERIPESIFDKYPEMLLEELILGPEITVAVLGEEALPAVEIIPPENEEFDYENKYNGRTRELCPPVNVGAAKQAEALQLAERVHRAMGCRHLSRTDMIVANSGQIYVLETNTIPGMTEASLFPRAAATAGISMKELARRFVEMASA